MKSSLTAILCLLLLTATASPAWAQTSRRGRYVGRSTPQRQSGQRYDSRYDNARRSNYDGRYRDRSVWDRSRDKLTVAGASGAGAIIGGLAGGGKGAVIGALIGAGGSALYTYKLRDREQRSYYRRR